MKRFTEHDIDEIADILKHDGVISVPTDTVYGVCARAVSKKAQENLRNVKHRPLTKAFPIMCADLDQVRTIAEVDERAEKIMKTFMPGPLTVILNKKEDVPDYVNGGMPTLAIRLATSEVLKEIISRTGSPLFMTSANQSGQPVCTSLEEIEKQCPLLDGMLEGSVSFGQASTIVDCTKEKLTILREGPISLSELEKIV